MPMSPPKPEAKKDPVAFETYADLEKKSAGFQAEITRLRGLLKAAGIEY